MSDNPEQVTRYPLSWPAWMAERVAVAANARAMSVATWMREAALEKLERTACTTEAVFGPDDRIPCILPRGHDGKHQYVPAQDTPEEQQQR